MAFRSTNSFLRDQGAMIAFGSFTAVGCIFICASKLLGLPALVVTGIPVILMILYAVLNWASNGLRVHDEQAGDNLYYMGFLFTLTSLGVSLYQFTSAASIDDIVRNFGVAVASTIFGIGLRILFNQTRRDPLDIERSTRHDLAEMVRQVKTEMLNASLEFANHRRASHQMLEEGYAEIANSAELAGQKILQALESLTVEAMKPIQESAAKVSELLESQSKALQEQLAGSMQNVDRSAQALNTVNSQLEISIKRFVEAIDVTGEKLRKMKTPEEVLKIELGSIISQVANVTTEHTQRMEQTSAEQREQFKQIRETFAPVEKVIAGLDRSIAATENLTKTIQTQNIDFQAIVRNLPGGRPPPLPTDAATIEPQRNGTNGAHGVMPETQKNGWPNYNEPAEPPKKSWFNP